MRSTYFASALLCLGLLACHHDEDDVQPRNVPLVVREALIKAYPLASNIAWEKEGVDYEAEFSIGTGGNNTVPPNHAALLKSDGYIVMQKRTVAPSALPESIKAYISNNFKGAYIEEAAYVVTANTSLYQVELEVGDGEKELAFSTDGQLLNNYTYWD